jgi:2-polyprenyl-3-methyl-5-hydroxy-6-metoxy-1,4-benzoquinol methylase
MVVGKVKRALAAIRDLFIPQRSRHATPGDPAALQVCPVCDDDRFRIYRHDRLNRTVICWRCGMFYTNPIPSEQELRQRVAESSCYTDDQTSKLPFFTRRAETLLSRVEETIAPGRLLDIGCAIGTELVVAGRRGWEATGIELSTESVRYARDRGLTVLDVPLHECGFSDGEFDLVTLNHVLEHIHEPKPFLEEVRRVLKPDGLLFIAVPNVNGLKRYWLGRNYHWIFHADHFLHFSPTSLSRLLRRHGFTPLELSTSRCCDFHDELADRTAAFRAVNALVERAGRGIEIFCLARPTDGRVRGPRTAAGSRAESPVVAPLLNDKRP